jgi:hypothetical protein
MLENWRIGDRVRINDPRHHFPKEYNGRGYEIISAFIGKEYSTICLKDLNDSYYDQSVTIGSDRFYCLEKC